MATKRSYDQILCNHLRDLPANTFFDLSNKGGVKRPQKDFDKIIEHIKLFIDLGEPFELNTDYTSVKRLSDEMINEEYHKMKVLPSGITIKKIERGTIIPVEIHHKKQVKTIDYTVERGWYEVYYGEKLLTVK